MHHQRSARSLRLLRVGAYHFLLNILIGSSAICGVAYGAWMLEERVVYLGVAGAILWALSTCVFFFKGLSLKCPLCMNQVWAGRKCQKHSKAKPALGLSYRLGVAISIVFKGRYRCPYCGELFSATKAHEPRKGKGASSNKGERRIRNRR